MSFLHPEFLYYMLPPLLILFGFLLTQKESQATFFSDEVMEKLRVSANTLTLQARNALFMLMGILIVIALAGPIIKEGKVEVKAKSADIMIAIDISDSMLAEDVYPNRLKLAKQKALELLHLAPNERVGIIAYAKNSYLVSPLSFDHDAVSFLLRQLNTDSITEKGTNFLSMLEVVDKSIKNDSKKYLLILSDGGDSKDFSKEISYAKEKNITVFTLGLGTLKGAPIKLKNGEFIKKDGDIIVSKLNEYIATLATKTGGVYIQSVNSNDDITTMLSEIENHSVKKELKSQEITRFIPLFYFPLGLAMFIFLIATSSMSKRQTVSLPSAFLLAAFLLNTQNLDAGLLDFVELKKAKEAYENREYSKSAKLYQNYADETGNPHSYFNAANALYKQGKYKEAIKQYENAVFQDDKDKFKKQSNLGNSHAKLGTQDDLKKAKKYYEEALKLYDDEDIKSNLEEVKKRIKKKKKEPEQKNKNKNKDKKNKKKDKKKDKDQDKKKDQKSNDQKKDSQDKKSDGKQEKKSDEKKRDKADKKKSDKDKLKELEKDQKKSQVQNNTKKNEMSDAEEKKWLKKLNQQPSTYLYKLNTNNSIEEHSNENPW